MSEMFPEVPRRAEHVVGEPGAPRSVVPAQRHSETSKAAAEAVEPDAQSLRALVLRLLKNRRSHGATDEEMQQFLDMNPSTQRPRRVELVKAGHVVDSGVKRETRSGRKAVVWVVADAQA